MGAKCGEAVAVHSAVRGIGDSEVSGSGGGSDLPPVMSLPRWMRETLEPAYVRSLLPSVLASVPAHSPSKSATEAGAASP